MASLPYDAVRQERIKSEDELHKQKKGPEDTPKQKPSTDIKLQKEPEVTSSSVSPRKRTLPPKEIHLKGQNRCFIFSNRFLGKRHELPQNEIDENNLEKTFEWLNFKVEIKRDTSLYDFRESFRQILKEDYSDSECVVFIFITHGAKEKKLYSNDERLFSLDEDVIEKLMNTKALNGTTKLLFVSACRGSELMKTVDVQEDDSQFVRAGVKRTVEKAKDADLFTFFATTEGKIAWGNAKEGSYFISTLCQVLQDYGGDYSLNDIVTKVNELLATDVRRNPNTSYDIVSVGEVHHTLTYKLYFGPKGLFHDKVK